MYLERKEDLSVVYFIKNLFITDSFIQVEDSFPTKTLTIPTVAVDKGKLKADNFELGNRVRGLRNRIFRFEIFAKNDTQRDEIGYKILNSFTDGISVYDFDLGFPPVVVPVIEHLNVISVEYDPMFIDPNLVDKMYYRATVKIVVTNDTV